MDSVCSYHTDEAAFLFMYEVNKMGKFIDLTGNRYDKLVVLNRETSKVRKNGRTRTMWNCLCDCGNSVVVDADHLRSGHSKSCGCITRKHGMFGTRIYKIWEGMKARCFN